MQVHPLSLRPSTLLSSEPFEGHSSIQRRIRRFFLMGCVGFGLMAFMGLFQACAPVARDRCKEDKECPAETPSCLRGYCFKKCSSSTSCSDGESCNSTFQVCVKKQEEDLLKEAVTEPIGSSEKKDETVQPPSERTQPEPPVVREPVHDGGNLPEKPADRTGEPNIQPDVDEPVADVRPPTDTDEPTGDRPSTECRPGQKRDCYSGLLSTVGVGPCKMGTQTCTPNGTWGACTGEVVPQVETCDGQDNDCDGKTDEDFPTLTQKCTLNTGECAGIGVYACKPNGSSAYCKVQGKQSSPELCDGKDNDCDGLVDEDFKNLGKACFAGVGACKRQGSVVCSADKKSTLCTAKAGPAYAERCNGRDDNCNGQIDELFTTLGQPCRVGVGSCQATGKNVCDSAGTGVKCSAIPAPPRKEVCDGKDNDCNGKIDDNLQNLPLCSKQQGVCKGSRRACVSGRLLACSKSDYERHDISYEEKEASCDGKDNDCNGKTDESFTNLGTQCTPLACSNGPRYVNYTGIYVCDPTTKKSICNVLIRKEVCGNAADDNCNGTVDEGCALCQSGTSRSCYFGPPNTEGIGICNGSSQSCRPNGIWGSCSEWTGPSTETCSNKRDENCDGRVDENCQDCEILVKTHTFNDEKYSGAILGVAALYSDVFSTVSIGRALKSWQYARKPPRNGYLFTGPQGRGHNGAVISVAAARRGYTVLSGGLGGILIHWNTRGAIRHRFVSAHKSGITAVAINRQGTIGVSGASDKTIKLWDLQKRALLYSIPATLHTDSITKLALDVRSRWLVSGSDDKSIRVWDWAALTQATPTAKSYALTECSARGTIRDVVFSKDGSYLGAACGTDYLVWKLNAQSLFKLAFVFAVTSVRPGIEARSLEFSADHHRLFGGVSDGRILQYNLDKAKTAPTFNKPERTYVADTDSINDLTWLESNGSLISVSQKGKITEWRCLGYASSAKLCVPGNTQDVYNSIHKNNVTDTIYNRFGTHFFTSSSKGTIKKWSVSSPTSVGSFVGHTASVTSLALSPSGKLLASGGQDGTVRIWDPLTFKERLKVEVKNTSGKFIAVNDVAFQADSLTLVAAGQDGVLRLIDAQTGKILRTTAAKPVHTSAIVSVDCSKRYNSFIVSIDASGKVVSWNSALTSSSRSWSVTSVSPTLLTSLRIHVMSSNHVVTIVAGQTMIPDAMKRWSRTGSLYKTYALQAQGGLYSVSSSPGGEYLVVGGEYGELYIIDVKTSNIVRSFAPHSGKVIALSWGFVGDTLLSAEVGRKAIISDCLQGPR